LIRIPKFEQESALNLPDEISTPTVPPLKSEQLLLGHELPSFERALIVSPGRAQLAVHLAQTFPQATVDAWYFDLYPAELAKCSIQSSTTTGPRPTVVCSPDLPEQNYQLVAIPLLSRGEAELARDLIQQAHQRLDRGGTLAVSVDNEKDSWLLNQMKEHFKSVSSFRSPQGSIYLAKKTGPIKRVRDFSCEFAFRDQERLISIVSEPGVFSHRRFDPGARQLINACEIEDGDRVLDLGCGSAGVALAAAFQTTAEVWAVDCNTRAIRCAEKGARLNQLTNIRTLLNADGSLGMDDQFELALANPPYYSDHAISKRFADSAWDCLVVGGALITVTKPKQASWFEDYFHQRDMEDIVTFPSGEFTIICGRKSW
jgi:16S rRNA G1207 methylase RsmC